MNNLKRKELAKKLGDKLARNLRILEKRYSDCDCKGHINPVEEENICYHCYRRLQYSTLGVDTILEDRKNLFEMDYPLDAPLLMEQGEQEIGQQKSKDFYKGLEKIAEELRS